MLLEDLSRPARALYVSRPVLNGWQIRRWAKEQGFASALADGELHVTLAYSKLPICWEDVPPSDENAVVSVGGERAVTTLGKEGAVVLRFEDAGLRDRWSALRDAGCSWDHKSYKPHVTLTYAGAPRPPEKIAPYRGPIVLGPERMEPIRMNWSEQIVESPLTEAALPARSGITDLRPPNARDWRGNEPNTLVTFKPDGGAVLWYWGLPPEGMLWPEVLDLTSREADPSFGKPLMSHASVTPDGALVMNRSNETGQWSGERTALSGVVRRAAAAALRLRLVSPTARVLIGNVSSAQGEDAGSVGELARARGLPPVLALYHGTSARRLPIIRDEGLRPVPLDARVWRGNRGGLVTESDDAVYLTASREQAAYYAKRAANSDRTRMAYRKWAELKGWLTHGRAMLAHNPDDAALADRVRRAEVLLRTVERARAEGEHAQVILRVEIPQSEFRLLRADDDFLRANPGATRADWRRSLTEFGQVCYMRPIAPARLSVVSPARLMGPVAKASAEPVTEALRKRGGVDHDARSFGIWLSNILWGKHHPGREPGIHNYDYLDNARGALRYRLIADDKFLAFVRANAGPIRDKGWHLTAASERGRARGVTLHQIVFEPILTAPVPRAGVFWHVTPSSNVPSILRDGLLPRASRHGGLSYPQPRVYLIRRREDAAQMVEVLRQRDTSGRPYALLRVDLRAAKGVRLRTDPELKNVAVYTTEAIPAALLRAEGPAGRGVDEGCRLAPPEES